MMQPLVSIPPSWNSKFDPLPINGRWDDLGRMCRGDANTLKQELALLMEAAQGWDVAQNGPDGRPVLVQVLQGWERHNIRQFWYHLSGPVATLPIPGEPPWDGTGNVEPWVLPAALLVARGADPFAVDAQGNSGFSLALAHGAATLCRQMLRLPQAPSADQWPVLDMPHSTSFPAVNPRLTLPALHVVAAHGPPLLLEVLLNAGADPDSRDAAGSTPLMRASTDNAALLLQAGARPMAEDHGGLTALEHWATADPASNRRDPKRREKKDFWISVLKGLSDPEERRRAFMAALFFGDPDLVQAVPGKPKRPQWIHTYAHFGPGLNAVEWALVGSLLRLNHIQCLVDTQDQAAWPQTTQILADTVAYLRNQDGNGMSCGAFERLAQVWADAGLPPKQWLIAMACMLRHPVPAEAARAIPMSLAAFSQLVLPFLAQQTELNPGWDMRMPDAFRNEVESLGTYLDQLNPTIAPGLMAPRMQLWARVLKREKRRGSPPFLPLPEGWQGSLEAQHLSQEWPLLRTALVANQDPQAVAFGDMVLLGATVAEPEPSRPRLRM